MFAGKVGLSALAAVLSHTISLQHLDVSHNPLSDEGACVIAKALSENKGGLTHLNMSSCTLGRSVARHLATAIRRSVNFTNVSSSAS